MILARHEINDLTFLIAYNEQDEEIQWDDCRVQQDVELWRMPYAMYELLDTRVRHQIDVAVQQAIAEARQERIDDYVRSRSEP